MVGNNLKKLRFCYMTILENWSSITTIYIFKIELLQNIVEYRFSRMLFTALKYFGCCRVEKRSNMLPRRAEKIIDKEHRSSDVQHVYKKLRKNGY